MEKHIYFVRHGQTDSNKDGMLRGENAMLNDRGRKQANIVAERIEQIGVEALIASPFPRAMETADYISKRIKLPVEQSGLFVEVRRASVTNGLHREDPEALELTTKIFEGLAIPGFRHSDEENLDDLKERANAALALLAAHPKDRICVVTHGLFMRVLFCAAVHGDDFSGETLMHLIRALETANTNVTHFVLRQDPFHTEPLLRWYVENWNDATHLD